jgi:fructose-bisphosphate aldolase class II
MLASHSSGGPTVEAIKTINPSVLVEGEIGDIGTGSEIHNLRHRDRANLTTPEEARQFVSATGIDVLAPAVGNMHGMDKSMVQGKERKRLDVHRIAQIKQATGVFITLHGGSGTEDEDLRKAIASGINIIHIDTEVRVAWRRSLDDSLARNPEEVVPYRILRPVVASAKEVISARMSLFANNHASEEAAQNLGK